MSLAAAGILLALAVLAALAFGPDARAALGRRRARRPVPRRAAYDPGRERRAELRARELLRSVVGDGAYEMYRELGFIRVRGGQGPDRGYGYLIYAHRPIVAYEERSGELLNEYCVGFPDQDQSATGERLPDSDDVLAKWMALHGDERRLIGDANMHMPGRQVDPTQVRRDLLRLGEWEGRRRNTALQGGDEPGTRNEERGTRNEVSA
ncbi:MAG: hypothetical protein AABM29_04045 [Actinomycetota bacterium]